MTEAGFFLGTAAYMSAGQANGQPVRPRPISGRSGASSSRCSRRNRRLPPTRRRVCSARSSPTSRTGRHSPAARQRRFADCCSAVWEKNAEASARFGSRRPSSDRRDHDTVVGSCCGRANTRVGRVNFRDVAAARVGGVGRGGRADGLTDGRRAGSVRRRCRRRGGHLAIH